MGERGSMIQENENEESGTKEGEVLIPGSVIE
jgi:hypothetical protein